MQTIKASIDPKGNTLTIVIDLEAPRPSASGKTIVIASTHGNIETPAKFNGKTVVVGLNAYVRQ
jgi:hypothetical protein